MASKPLPGRLEKIKNEYYRLLEERLQNSKTPPLSKTIVTDLIKGMLAWKRTYKRKVWYMGKYKLKVKQDRYMLQMRQEDKRVLIVVPWEESFPYVWAAHVKKGHGNVLETHKAIKSEYVVESVCAEILTHLCFCNTFNKCVYLSVLEISEAVNNFFRFVLIYEDSYSGFVQLRPLHQNNLQDIVIELIKIFSDTGAPSIIQISLPNLNVYDLTNYLSKVWPFDKIGIIVYNHNMTNTLVTLLQMMKEWLTEYEGPNKTYYYGWYVVQHKFNTLKNGEGPSPLEKTFPYLTKTNITGSSISQNIPVISQKDKETEAADIEQFINSIKDDDLYYYVDTESIQIEPNINSKLDNDCDTDSNEESSEETSSNINTSEKGKKKDSESNTYSAIEKLQNIIEKIGKPVNNKLLIMHYTDKLDDDKTERVGDKSKKPDDNSETDDDVEIIENRTEVIELDDEDDEMKSDVDNDGPPCISCKKAIKTDLCECKRCGKDAHATCSTKNESDETVCLPCAENYKNMLDNISDLKEE